MHNCAKIKDTHESNRNSCLSTMLLLIALITSFFLLLYVYCRRKLNYWNRLGVPNTSPSTPLGDIITCFREKKNINLLCRDMSLAFKKRGEKFFGLYFSFSPIFVPFDHELIKTMLTKDHDHFPDRGVYIDRNQIPISDNPFSATAARWKYLRELLSTVFTPAKVKNMSTVVDNYAQVFCEVIENHHGEPANIFDLGKRYALDIACSCFFGTDEEYLRKGTSPLLKITKKLDSIDTSNVLKVCLSDGLSNPGYIFKALIMGKDLNNYMLRYSEQLYEIRKTQKSPRNDLLNMIMTKLDDGADKFDFTAFASMIFIIIIATYETNAYSLTYVLYQLAVEKEVQRKVRNEILETMKKHNGKLSAESVSELDYLDRVLIESLRIHTVVPIFNRYCAKDYKIPGTNVVIEKGTPVLIPSIAVHNDPDLFPNPQKFNPDRFLDPDVRQYTMVYGNGYHYCLGKVLGKMLVKTVLVQLLLKHEVSVNERTGKLEHVVFRKHLTSSYKNTIWLDFKKLENGKS